MNTVEEQFNETNVLNAVSELSAIIEEYDNYDRESGIVPYSEADKLKNVKRALAEKLSSETGKDFSECEKEADKIVEDMQAQLAQPNVKKKICNALKTLSSDINSITVGTITGVIVALIQAGAIAIPAAIIGAIPGFGLGLIGLICSRMILEFYCTE